MALFLDLLRLIGSVILALVIGLFGLLGAGGCATSKENWDVQKSQLEQVIVMMKETRTAGTVSIHWNGRPSVGFSQDFYLESGVSANANIQVNATEGDAVTP